MSDVFVIPKPSFAVVLFALFMCAQTVLMTLIVFDDLPPTMRELVVAVGGWFWWLFLLWQAATQV